MTTKVRAALLSGLVLPGLGQWAQGRRKAGALSAAGFLLLLLALAIKIAYIAYDFWTVAGMTMAEVHRRVYGIWWLILPLLAIWIWSTVDAYMVGKKTEPGRGERGGT
ncbi:MAG: hypothetical protein R6V10_08395 [bacterium]